MVYLGQYSEESGFVFARDTKSLPQWFLNAVA